MGSIRQILISLGLMTIVGLCFIEVACQQETPGASSGGGGTGSTGTTTTTLFPSTLGFSEQPQAISSSLATVNTAQNYVNIFYYLMVQLDRDYANLTAGVPNPGLISYVEGFMQTLNNLGAVASSATQTLTSTLTAGLPNVNSTCTTPSASCTAYKFLVRSSLQPGSLFGLSLTFGYDVVAWANNGGGYARFLEGKFTPGSSNAGKGNVTLITCPTPTCTTATHGTLQWDATGTFTHVRGTLYNVVTSVSPSANGSLIVDMAFDPSTTEIYLTHGLTNFCDNTAANLGTSTCTDTGASPYTVGYAGALHAKWSTGNVFVWGVTNANNTVSGPVTVADQACIDNTFPPVVDSNTTTACHTDGTDNFNSLTSYYGPNDANNLSWSTSLWPLSDITDTPTF